MNRISMILLLCVGHAGVAATSVHGAIVAMHDPAVVGNGNAPLDSMNLTLDTATGREWLDLTLSQAMTYNAMVAQLGPGGMFDGFQHASNDDVLELWTHLGLSSSSFPSFSSVADGGVLADAAIDLLGETGTTSGIRFTQGTTTAVPFGTNHQILTIRDDGDSTTVGNGSVGDGTGGAQIGHWLFRQQSVAVPEPSSGVLMVGVVLGGVVVRRWNLRRGPQVA